MKKEIEVCRIGYAAHTFSVEGDTEEELREKALEMADNHVFDKEHHSELVFPGEGTETDQLLELALDGCENALGLLDTPIQRRKFGDDPFVAAVIESLKTAIQNSDRRREPGSLS